MGWTPLYEAPRLAASLGLKHLWVKDDGRQATASFKDRASAIAVVKAQEKGAAIITTASTGNAAAALSGLCASVQQPNVIFVPESAPPAKIAQLLTFGSTVMLVHGTYDDAFELCLQAAETYGWYNRNTGFNPYMSEGKKTVSFEICEQLTLTASPTLTPSPSPSEGEGSGWQAPDAIFVSVGDGCIIGGVHKGLKDLLALGWIDKMPRIYGVQAAGSNFMAEAWQAGLHGLRRAGKGAHRLAHGGRQHQRRPAARPHQGHGRGGGHRRRLRRRQRRRDPGSDPCAGARLRRLRRAGRRGRLRRPGQGRRSKVSSAPTSASSSSTPAAA